MLRSCYGLLIALLPILLGAGILSTPTPPPDPVTTDPQVEAPPENDAFADAPYAGIPIGGQVAEVRSIPRAEDVAEGVERGLTPDGIPYMGRADAQIQFAVFVDFTCPHCAAFNDTLHQLIENYVRPGLLTLEIYPIPVRGEEATEAARAALCASEQGYFWEYADTLYATQSEGASTSTLNAHAAALGLNQEAFTACLNVADEDPIAEALANVVALVQQYGVSGVPTVLYRLPDTDGWLPVPDASGQISGQRPYTTLERLIVDSVTR